MHKRLLLSMRSCVQSSRAPNLNSNKLTLLFLYTWQPNNCICTVTMESLYQEALRLNTIDCICEWKVLSYLRVGCCPRANDKRTSLCRSLAELRVNKVHTICHMCVTLTPVYVRMSIQIQMHRQIGMQHVYIYIHTHSLYMRVCIINSDDHYHNFISGVENGTTRFTQVYAPV